MLSRRGSQGLGELVIEMSEYENELSVGVHNMVIALSDTEKIGSGMFGIRAFEDNACL